MTPIITANVEQFGGKAFLVAIVYEQGRQHDAIVRPYEGDTVQIAILAEQYLAQADYVEVYTSTTEVYKALHQQARVFVQLKHRSDTSDTRNYLVTHKDVIGDIYELDFAVKPPLKGWRKWLYKIMIKLTKGYDCDGI